MLQLNRHHLLYQRKKWNTGWALKLRNHHYMIKTIPMDTLHREIHSKVENVPQPSGKECKDAYELISLLDSQGRIDDKDTIEHRIDILLLCFNNPATREALLKQREVVSHYYKGGK